MMILRKCIAFVFAAYALAALMGCAQNRAKIAYTSPPETPAMRHRGLIFAGPVAAPAASPQDDAGMTDAIESLLLADARVRATNVRVSVRKQVVTLYGVLNSQAAKDAALQDCLQIRGVRHVDNLIAVDPEG